MNPYLCIFICFTVGIIIYSLLKSYCNNDIIEGGHSGGAKAKSAYTATSDGAHATCQSKLSPAPTNPIISLGAMERATHPKCCTSLITKAASAYTDACKVPIDENPVQTATRLLLQTDIGKYIDSLGSQLADDITAYGCDADAWTIPSDSDCAAKTS